jgi:hypothetical protein
MIAPAGARAQNMLQPYKLINGPTAGVLAKGTYDLEFIFYPAGDSSYASGMITGIPVGVTDRFSLGLSYGGEGVIGRGGRARGNPLPGVYVKYRLFEERYATPALSFGFDNQGYGGIADEAQFGYSGYIYKSPGFFAAASKNYLLFNTVQIGFHIAANYSLEGLEDVAWPDAVGGVDIGINEELAIIFEYDCALNDITGNQDDFSWWNPIYGFFNIGLRWAFTPNFHMELGVKDIFENKMRFRPSPPFPGDRTPNGWTRELKIVYIAGF